MRDNWCNPSSLPAKIWWSRGINHRSAVDPRSPVDLRMTMIGAIPGRWSRSAIRRKNSRRTTWRNERTKEVQERVTWTSHGVDSYTLPALIWRHGRVSYQPGGSTPVKSTPVGGKLKHHRKHAQLAQRRWWWRKASREAPPALFAGIHPVFTLMTLHFRHLEIYLSTYILYLSIYTFLIF